MRCCTQYLSNDNSFFDEYTININRQYQIIIPRRNYQFVMPQYSVSALPVLTICFLTGLLLLLLPHNVLINKASAHITKKFGSIQVQVGWSDEPPLTGLLNNVIVDVNQP